MNAVTITAIKSKEKVILVGRVYQNLIHKVKLQLDQVKKIGTFLYGWQESPVRQKKKNMGTLPLGH